MRSRINLGGLSIVLACWLFLTLPGCGDGKPSVDASLNEATVAGVVTVQGKPATGGKILFNPSNSGRIVPTREAEISSDGTYTIKTFTGDNRVTFNGEVAAKNRGVGLIKEYADVKSGENKIDFDLMGEGRKVGAYDLSKMKTPRKR